MSTQAASAEPVPFEPPAGPVLTDDDSPLDRWNEPLARALRAASGR